MTNPQHPRLTKECREVLRGESSASLRAHTERCAFCTDWLRRRAALQELLRVPVAPPSELQAARLLTGVRERIVEQCERSPIGRALDDAIPVAPAPEGKRGWPEPLLASGLAERITPSPAAPPTARDWTAVRNALLEDIASAATQRAARYRVAGAVGLAAAIVLSLILLRGRDAPREVPEIDVVDVSALPDLPFAPMTVLRKGGER